MNTTKLRYSDTKVRNRRSEVRNSAAGVVHLRRSGALSEVFPGRLTDISKSGFRARHNCLQLTSGEIVEFECAEGRGLAQPVWTRLLDGEAETGFRILSIAKLS